MHNIDDGTLLNLSPFSNGKVSSFFWLQRPFLSTIYAMLGGAFDYWSGNGYNNCYALINEQFANVSVPLSPGLISFLPKQS
jgi:hypothetical protein